MIQISRRLPSLSATTLVLLISAAGRCSSGGRIWLPPNLLDLASDGTNNAYGPGNQGLQARATSDNGIDGVFVGLRRGPLEYKLDRRHRQRHLPIAASALNRTEIVEARKRAPEPIRPPLVYVVSPLSDQILPIGSEKLSQGYQNFVTLADNYKVGLQRLIDEGPHLSVVGPTEGRLDSEPVECRTVQSRIQLTRDNVDKTSGQVLSSCKGWAQLNRCEGSCSSSVQPSIRVRTGFKKECACCNEGAFRRVQVRLNDCRQTPAGSRKILLAAEEDQADLAYYRKVSEQPTELGFMDVEVEEPIECKCRRCDSTLW